MSELVWSETNDIMDSAEKLLTATGYDAQSHTTGAIKKSLFRDDNKVSFVKSHLEVGYPKGHPNKRWYKWQSYEAMGLLRNKAGNVVPFHCRKPINATKRTPWTNCAPSDVFTALGHDNYDEYTRHVRDVFGITGLNDVYPLAQEFGISRYTGMPYLLRHAMRNRTLQDFAVEMFAKSRVDDSLLKAIPNTEPELVALTSQMRGAATQQQIINFMELNPLDMERAQPYPVPVMRKMWLCLDYKSIDNLLCKSLDASAESALHILYSRAYASSKPGGKPLKIPQRPVLSFIDLSALIY